MFPLALSILPLCSCSNLTDPSAEIQTHVSPQTGREYALFRPSRYTRDQTWTLLIVCSSASGERAIRPWTGLAEQHGFLVAAPDLLASEKPLPLSLQEDARPRKNRDNETHILAAVEHIRAGHNISEDRIFIHGADKAAVSALRAGLKHADIFRAVSIVQPRFERETVADIGQSIDPYQPVYLSFRASDLLTGDEGRQCADWLRANGADLRLDPLSAGEDPERTVRFLQDVLRTTQWMRVHGARTDSGNPLELRFSVRIDPPPAQFHWSFGDGGESLIAEPVHTYAKPGSYRVKVTVSGPKLGELTRYVDVTVPAGTLKPTHGPRAVPEACP